MPEVEVILNFRPLTVETLNDACSHKYLSTAELIAMKLKFVLIPPGQFQKADVNYHRRWQRAQHLANEFCSRWRK